MVDRVAVMLNGSVQQVAPPQQLYRQPVNRAVADFVGDANFLPGTAHGRHVECELGTLETINEARGAVDILLRPENMTLAPASADARCRIRQQLFFGHDQLITVQFDSGRVLNVRVGPLYHYAVGQPVQIGVEGPVVVYEVKR